MSVLSGIVTFGGETPDRGAAEAMARRGFLLEEDRQGLFLGGAVALACRQFNTTPEAATEAQPETLPGTALRIVLDGRLDNRPELLRTLDLPTDPAANDPQLILHAYRRWGVAAVDHLWGDFAFALWDGEEERLLLARDLVGSRSLFYARNDRRIVFASQIEQLRQEPDLRQGLRLDREFLADYMVCAGSRPDRTPFREIRKLPPGHLLVVEQRDGQGEVRRYWQPSQEKLILRDEREYIERFRELFFAAVERNLRSHTEVWSDLSGGLDSPSVVCVAQEVLRNRNPAPSFATVTVVFDQARESDEREWAQLVLDQYSGESPRPLRNTRILGDDHYPFRRVQEGARFWDEPHSQLCSYSLNEQYASLMAAAGARVLLNGSGSEEVLTGEAPEPLHLPDLLRRGQLRRYWRELSAWQRHLDSSVWNLLVHSTLKPLLQPRRNYYLSLTNRGVARWVHPRFVRQWDLHRRVNQHWTPRMYRSTADQWQFERLARIPPALAPGYLGKAREFRYPFLYRPLIEFGLAVPWERKVRPGLHKPILRQGMEGILPEKLRMRREKPGAEHAFYLAVAREWPQLQPLAREPLLADLGIVDGQAFYHAMQQARHGHADQLAVLAWTMALEIWMRAHLENP